MKSKLVAGIMLAGLLIGMSTSAFDIQPVEASGTIAIEADGSINPPSANITSSDNITYTFTDNNYGNIVVYRNNIIIDGDGYTLKGSGSEIGFELFGISNVTIKNTNINSTWTGVEFSSSSYNTVSGNTITNSTIGVVLHYSHGNTVSGNNITDNNYGVYLSLSDINTFSGNTITHSTSYGVHLVSSSYNTVSGNNITDNNYGVYLQSSSYNNKFYHNNFIDNNQQVYIGTPSPPNYWNSSYPSGGNYWSNYTGFDLYSGQSQNETGFDGIGDTPHVIDANNIDNYPHMNRDGWGPVTIIPDPTGGQKNLTVDSNATLTHVVATKNTLHFDATGPPGQTAYVNVTIPVGLNTTAIKVSVNGVRLTPPPFPIITTNSTHYFVYFEFTLSTHSIDIQFGPTAVGGISLPVDKLALLAPYIGLTMLLAVAIVTVVYVKKRKRNTEINSQTNNQRTS